jgi:hypothetical protein
VPTFSQRIDVSGVGKIFTGKEKADIFLFVPDRKAIGERSLVIDPAEPEAKLLIDIHAIHVKRLMHQAFNHGLHQSIKLLRWSLADYPNDARHIVFRGRRTAAFAKATAGQGGQRLGMADRGRIRTSETTCVA